MWKFEDLVLFYLSEVFITDKRLELHEKLVDILGEKNVYFQPPENIKLSYPCIIYELDDFNFKYANNEKYHKAMRYSIKVITKSPDTVILNKLLSLPYTSFDRYYTNDNLNHYILEIYY